MTSNLSAFSGSGSGTEADPYQITDVHQLQEMNDDLSAHYIIINDIDASDTSMWNDGNGFEFIGNHSNGFTGTLNGQGYAINNLFMDYTNEFCIGLFGGCSHATIVNVNMNNFDYTCGGNTEHVDTQIGGLIGWDEGSTVENCHVTGTIQCIDSSPRHNTAGGLIGYKGYDVGYIKKCSADVDINGNGDIVGGLVGRVWVVNNIQECYSYGSVSGGKLVTGGLIGHSYGASYNDCYSKTNVTNLGVNGKTGGFIGTTKSDAITNSYSSGYIDTIESTPYIGGFVGYNDGDGSSITSSYWNIDTSGQTTSDGGTGLTDSEMQVQSNFTNWDFTDVWTMEPASSKYPILKIQALFAGGNGTESNPYKISNVYELQNMKYDLDAHYILVNDIDASDTVNWNSGAGFEPIDNFNGSLDGKNHTIKGIYIDRFSNESIGLFQDFSNVTIKNLYLTGINYTVRDDGKNPALVGGLVSNTFQNNIIENCHVNGSITIDQSIMLNKAGRAGGLIAIGHSCIFNHIRKCSADVDFNRGDIVGGLMGQSFKGNKIKKCFSYGNISGRYTGGLIGVTHLTTVVDSYSKANVTNIWVDGYIGGFIGYDISDTTIEDSYALGHIYTIENPAVIGGFIGEIDDTTVKNSYWNIDKSGQSISNGGDGLNDKEMKDHSNFNGWNFIDTWRMDHYPALQWEPDHVAPKIKINSPKDMTYALSDVLFNISTHEISEWCGYSLDGASNLTMKDNLWDWTELKSSISDGQHSLKFSCNDSAGNTNITDILHFHVDTQPPNITIGSPDNSTYIDDHIWFNATTDEDAGWCGYSLDGAPNVTMDGSLMSWYKMNSSMTDGLHNVVFSCNDLYGNLNITNPLYFKCDTEGPKITIVSPLNITYYSSLIWFNITANDTYSSVDWCGYSLDGTSNLTMKDDGYNWTGINSSMTDGLHNVNFTCNDSSGNLNTEGPVYFNISTATNCTEYCTDVTINLCNPNCDNCNGCSYHDLTSSTSCQGKPPGTLVNYDVGRYVECCEGVPTEGYMPSITYVGREPLVLYAGETKEVAFSLRNPNDINLDLDIEMITSSELRYWVSFTSKNNPSSLRSSITLGPYERKYVVFRLYGGKAGDYTGSDNLKLRFRSPLLKQSAMNEIDVRVTPIGGSNPLSRDVPGMGMISLIVLSVLAAFINLKSNSNKSVS